MNSGTMAIAGVSRAPVYTKLWGSIVTWRGGFSKLGVLLRVSQEVVGLTQGGFLLRHTGLALCICCRCISLRGAHRHCLSWHSH